MVWAVPSGAALINCGAAMFCLALFGQTKHVSAKHACAALLACAVIASLSSCGPSPNAPGAGGVTKAQAEELNQAAAALDKRTPATAPATEAH